MRTCLTLAIVMLASGVAGAQEPASVAGVPAAMALQIQSSLSLDSGQTVRLRDLARTQAAAMERATAAYLRAEAELLDASRSDDLALRRAALEKRSRLAIEAEMIRARSEKEVRSVLSSRQNAILFDPWTSRGRDRVPWQGLVAPVPLIALADQAADSGEVRVSVTPNHADIYVGDEKMGTGRRFIRLPVGKYDLRLFAIGCTEVVIPVEVQKGRPVIVSRELQCKQLPE